ncbi:MAG: M15 family metallopeptidase [Nitriliruptoraceae bacterium]
MQSDAERLGLEDRRQSLVVLHRGGEKMTDRLIAVLASVTDVPPHVSVLHPADDEPPIRLVLSLAQVKERFGEFSYRPRPGVREIVVDAAFADEHMVTTTVPILGEVRCHRLMINDLVAALNDVITAELDSWIDPRTYAGCHYPRRISTERARLSHHSWGIAIDFNVDLSMPGLGPVPPTEMIEIFGRHGFRWGGDFSQPDNHHWEWVGPHAIQRPNRSCCPVARSNG